MPRTISYVVKIVKDEHELFNIIPHCLDTLAFSIFIELSYSSVGDDLTFNGFFMKSPITISQCIVLHLPQPTTF
jgi:hypothetical protein